MKTISYWWFRGQQWSALSDVETLERRRKFIDPFFCGTTAYSRKLEKWRKDLQEAKDRLERADAEVERLGTILYPKGSESK